MAAKLSSMNEEALDLSNDILNDKIVLNGRDNNIMMTKTISRIHDNHFGSDNHTNIVHQSSDNCCLKSESTSTNSLMKVEPNSIGQEKMAEFFVHAYQEQQQQHQLSQLQSLLASLLTSSPNNVMAPWLSTKTALSSILHQLPAPTTSALLSFTSLHSLYANIQSTCLSLDKLLEQYFILFISAFLKSSHDKSLLAPLILGSHNESTKPSLKRKAQSPLHSPTSPPTIDSQADNNVSIYASQSPDNANMQSYLHSNNSRLFKRKKIIPNGNKKSNFRGTSEAENEIDGSFLPREVNGEIILCEEYLSVRLDKEVYATLTSKAPRSATRLIRLLMKHFFSQDTLARSSLSGEGIYKDRLKPEVIEAIKLFIKRRHPKLKNGSINLCMTDVCVQARRVNKNQRIRLPSSLDLNNSKTADSVTSGGYSPTMFPSSGRDCHYKILNDKTHSTGDSSNHSQVSCQSPLVQNQSEHSDLSLE